MRFGTDIKGVILDIDGVLLDSMEIWTDLGARYVTAMGLKAEENLGRILFSMSMEEGADYIRKHYLPEKTAEEISRDLKKMLQDFYYLEVKSKRGVAEWMRSLQDHEIRVTAATSSPRGHVEKALERNGLLAYIEKIYTSEEVGSGKHSPEIYNLAAAYMGLTTDRICVLEDSLYALKTAARAGYHTVGIYDEKGEPDQEGLGEAAEVYVRDMETLLAMF